MDVNDSSNKQNAEIRSLLIAINRVQAIIEFDLTGVIIAANENFLNLMGYQKDEVVGKHHQMFCDADYVLSKDYEDFWKRLHSGQFEAAVYKRLGKNGKEVWLNSSYNPVFDENGKIYKIVKFATDITEARNKNAEFEANTLKLENNSKMAALGEMSSGLAHEINNPLSVLSGKTQLLKKKFEKQEIDPKTLLQFFNDIEKVTAKITKIIKGLKMFSKVSSNDDPFMNYGIQEIIDETLSFCLAKFENNQVQVTTHFDYADKKSIECRPSQISQVLLNALNNSYDAIADQENKWIRIEVESLEYDIKIKITDSGPGIKKEYQSKVMNPFFTTKEIGKGTGLGLSISKGIIDSHGGKIYFNHDHATNTQLVIELPTYQIAQMKAS